MNLARLTPRRVESRGLLVVGGVLAVVGVVVAKWEGPSWILMLLAVLAAAAGVLLEYWTRRATEDDKVAATIANAAENASSGEFPYVRDVDRESFGVHRPAIKMDHLARDVEPQVREIVQSRRPLLLVGRSMTGKTHLTYQLLKDSYPDWRLCKPSRGEQAALFEDERSPSDVILWLDDLEGVSHR